MEKKRKIEMQQLHGIRYVQVIFFCTIIQLSWSILERGREKEKHAHNKCQEIDFCCIRCRWLSIGFLVCFPFPSIFRYTYANRLRTIYAFSSVQTHFFCLKQYALNAQFYFFKGILCRNCRCVRTAMFYTTFDAYAQCTWNENCATADEKRVNFWRWKTNCLNLSSNWLIQWYLMTVLEI